MRQETKTS